VLILGWKLGARTGFISKLILPAPSEALGALWNLIKSGITKHHLSP
jgi:NitT/TauT family transport system permease protein